MTAGNGSVDELRRHIGVLESAIGGEELLRQEIGEIAARLEAIENKLQRLTAAYEVALVPAFNNMAETYNKMASALEGIAAALAPKPPPPSPLAGLLSPPPAPRKKPSRRVRLVPTT
jgi:hypothetical protein